MCYDSSFSRVQIQIHINHIGAIYKQLYDLQAASIIEKINMHADSMIKRLALKCTNKRGNTVQNLWELKTIPAFDSSAMLNLATQKQLILTMFKASMFDSKVETANEVNDFFKQPESNRDMDTVDIIKSMQALESMQVKATLSSVDKVKLMRYIVKMNESYTSNDCIAILRQLDLDSDKSFYKQINQIIGII
jgi:hypothetical protein